MQGHAPSLIDAHRHQLRSEEEKRLSSKVCMLCGIWKNMEQPPNPSSVLQGMIMEEYGEPMDKEEGGRGPNM